MQIFVLILKIIAILLAVFLLLIGAVLAVPVRYHVDTGIEQQNLSGRTVFSWFFHIIDCRILYEASKVSCRLRIFGIPINLNREKKPAKSKKKKPAKSRKRIKKSGKSQEDITILPDKQNLPDKATDGREEQQITDTGGRVREEQHPPYNNNSPKGKNRKDRRKPFWRIRRFFRNLKQRFLDMKALAATFKEKIKNIKDLLFDESNRYSVGKVWKQLLFLIRHYSPRKLKGELDFGTGDPSKTGQILGALSILPFWSRYKVSIYPDFGADGFYVQGWIQMKGHIRLWHLLLSVVRLIKDKDIRQLLEKIRT